MESNCEQRPTTGKAYSPPGPSLERPAAEVHDLQIWEITSAQPALSAHVLVDAGQD
jgi:Co/Zn/Cd efflux system component